MNSSEIVEQLKSLIKGFASKENNVSIEFFDSVKPSIIQIIRYNPAVQDVDEAALNGYYDTAVKEYTSVYPVDINPSKALTRKGFQTWLTDERKKQIPENYIARYLTYLRNEGRSEAVISEISRSSEAILGKLGDPQSPSAIYTKGLVVGSVQSGKTGNFNAVINRAVDAGYNLVIILSGIMEDLRSQTQIRLETDVIGEGVINLQTNQQGVKGVGKIKRFGVQGNADIPQVLAITSHKSDFKKQVQDANFSLNHKNLLVCKKNTGVLKNLLIWLSEYLTENKEQHNIPLLIIDDEADNASLNNLGHKGREYASIINGHIRAILELFSRKTYLGYTATPFANVIQDRNKGAEGSWIINYKRNGEGVSKSFKQVDYIFPDDFIELLETPTNYIGAKQIFQTVTDPNAKKIPLVEPVTDHIDSFPVKVIDEPDGTRAATEEEIEEDADGLRSPRRDDPFPAFLPSSMIDAIECFVLAVAIRLKRRPEMAASKLHNAHNTMLIHISRFTEWQNSTRNLIQDVVNNLANRINNELPSAPQSVYAELEKTWNRYYAAIIANIRTYLPVGYRDDFLEPVVFEDIKSLLPDAIRGIEVKAINSVTKEKLTYSVDASGNGKKYIAVGGNRLSRGFTLEGLTINYFVRNTNYADTLLQMGRWFGYRPGYIDCCKLFTTWDAIEKFDAATRTIEELELEFKKMHRLGKTPDDFVIHVKKHPGVLEITRPSILKNAEEVKYSYQDKLFQTTEFEIDRERISKAWLEFRDLIAEHNWTNNINQSFYILERDTDIDGLFKFLNCANTFYEYDKEIERIKTFIRLCVEKGKLKKWRIAIKAQGRGNTLQLADTGLPGLLQMAERSIRKKDRYYNKLISKGIFTASGQSANIVTAGLDMSLWLEEREIALAEEQFIRDKTEEFIEDEKLTEEEARKEANDRTKPERIYREKMTDETGLLVIYFMDLQKILSGDELQNLKEERNIDVGIPLIGYALGFPPISEDIGGVYARGKYNIEEDEPEDEDYDEETMDANDDVI